MPQVTMTITEHDSTCRKFCDCTVSTVAPLKLPATDEGMAAAVELMDPFQTEPNIPLWWAGYSASYFDSKMNAA